MTQQPPLSSSWERKLECLPADNCSYSSSRLLLSPKLLFLSPLSTWHFSRVSVSWESGSSFSDLVVRNIRYVHIGNDFILGEIFFWENTHKNFSGIENRTGKLSSMLWMWTLLITGGKNNAEKDVYPFINRIPTKTECWLPPRKFFLNLSIIGKCGGWRILLQMTLNHQAKIVSICIIRTHTELKIVKSCTTNDNSLNKEVEILTKRDNN